MFSSDSSFIRSAGMHRFTDKQRSSNSWKENEGPLLLETLKHREPFVIFLLTSLFKRVNDLTEGAGRLKLKHSRNNREHLSYASWLKEFTI